MFCYVHVKSILYMSNPFYIRRDTDHNNTDTNMTYIQTDNVPALKVKCNMISTYKNITKIILATLAKCASNKTSFIRWVNLHTHSY